jgi:hypothetical protein
MLLDCVDPKDLDLIKCHHCKRELIHGEDTYSIVAGEYDTRNAKFKTLTIIDQLATVERRLNFHKGCFAEIAGDRYLP